MDIRNKFNTSIGNVIENTIGVDAITSAKQSRDSDVIKKLSNNIGNVQVKDIPETGDMVLTFGLVKQEVEEALFIAQAAEKTLVAMENIENLPNVINELKSKYNDYSVLSDVDVRLSQLNFPDTKHSIEMRKVLEDTALSSNIRYAVAVSATAQLYEEEQKWSGYFEIFKDKEYYNDSVITPVYGEDATIRQYVGSDYVTMFKAEALDMYRQSADMLANNSYKKLAEDIVSMVNFEQNKLTITQKCNSPVNNAYEFFFALTNHQNLKSYNSNGKFELYEEIGHAFQSKFSFGQNAMKLKC